MDENKNVQSGEGDIKKPKMVKYRIVIVDGRIIEVFLKEGEDHSAFRSILGHSKYVAEYDEVSE